MANIQGGSDTANIQNVDSNYNAQVNLPFTTTAGVDQGGGMPKAGFAAAAAESDPGKIVGTRLIRGLEASEDFRLRAGLDSILFHHSFEGTNIARDRIQQNDTTATAAQTTGILTINSGSSVTSGQGCNIRTYRTFPVFGSYPTYIDMWLREANPTATNAVSEWGLGYVSGVTAQVVDGVFFRRLSGGQLRAVMVFNSVDVATVDITTTNLPSRDGAGSFDATEINHYLITFHADIANFWINDVLVASIKSLSTQGSPTYAVTQPIFARVYNSGAASPARQIGIALLGASLGDMNANKPYGHQMAGFGGGAYQIQPGTASGPNVTRGAGSTGWPTSATARSAGTWTATSAPALNSLGGNWLSPAISTLTSEADYPIFAYLNPAGAVGLPGKTLYITHVKWGKTVATVAASTNSITLNYILGVGSTGSGTAVAEAAAAIAARGIVLDLIPFKSTAAVGDYVEGGQMDFSQAPLVVPPGCYIHFIVRPFGTVASNTLVVAGTVAFAGYFE
jgi:hypothetical protein